MPTFTPLDMPSPSGEELKAARLAAGLSQVQAAELMGYSVQAGSRGGLQSRTWQAMESPSGDRNMQGPVFAMFLLGMWFVKTGAIARPGNHPRLFERLRYAALPVGISDALRRRRHDAR